MDLNALRSITLSRILDSAARTRRQEINVAIYQQLGGVVQGGPFKGMKLPGEVAWLDGDIAPKLLGAYESELHVAIAQVAAGGYSLLVNVGAAEGYYAVGLARLMRQTKILAFDTNAKAQRICRQAVEMNGVSNVEVGGECTPATLRSILATTTEAFLLLDCEGGERQLLSPDGVPDQARCNFLAECHDFLDSNITPAIRRHFERTHDLQEISEGARDPNAYPILTTLGSLDRWLAVCEFRPQTMRWLAGSRKLTA